MIYVVQNKKLWLEDAKVHIESCHLPFLRQKMLGPLGLSTWGAAVAAEAVPAVPAWPLAAPLGRASSGRCRPYLSSPSPHTEAQRH